jgi:photosystem II stability/assembly factor-like uncharacterized protein
MRRVLLGLLFATSGLGMAGCGGDPSGTAPSSGGHMWAAGESGLMLSAFDGVNLLERSRATATALRALVGVDDQLAWAFGDGGTILTTRDAGATWTAVTSPVGSALRGASFADAGRGYAVGDEGVVLRTTDAGVTWTRLAIPTRGALRGVAAAPSGGLLLAVGEGGTVLRSTDGGDRFDRSAVPVATTLEAVRLAEDELHAIAVGAAGAVVTSEDGGVTWRAENAAPVDLRGVAFGGTGATAVGAGGFIWRRADGSSPFAAVASGTAVDLHAIKFDREAPSFGWIVGASGLVLYTTDGGAHFRPLPSLLRGELTTVEDF